MEYEPSRLERAANRAGWAVIVLCILYFAGQWVRFLIQGGAR